MFKLLFYLNILIVFIKLNEGKVVKSTINNAIKGQKESWQNLWFPYPPNYQNDVKPQSDWQGVWFPRPPITDEEGPKYKDTGKKQECDNGKTGLSIDFNPQDKRHSYNYLCLSNRSDYAPNLNTSALLKEYFIPAAYEPPVKCLNETIEYIDAIPTFGAYRPLAPKFGSYLFLPPQRWLHSLADGAIVLLYHPCAFAGQIEKLKKTLKSCLYRHIITPNQLLTPQHPLALLAWGKSLEMSVVDDGIVYNFIKNNAKMGFKQNKQNLSLASKLYDAGLLAEAHLVTDEQDTEICGYKEMR